MKMLAARIGRNMMCKVVCAGGKYSVANKLAKRMLQCLTNTSPTTAQLHLMVTVTGYLL
jgi:hypothetical protein